MADNIVESLFGPSPLALQMQLNSAAQQQAQQYANMTPMQRGSMSLFQAGQGLGGMFGGTHPVVQQAQQQQQALSGLDMSNPQSILAKAAVTTDPRLRIQLQLLAQQAAERQQKAALDSSTVALHNAQTIKALRENPNLVITEVGVKGRDGWLQRVAIDKTNPNVEPKPIGEPYMSAAAAKQQFHINTGDGGAGKQLYPYKDRQTGEIKWGNNLQAAGNIPLAYDPTSKALLAAAGEGGKSGAEMNAAEFTAATQANAALPAMVKLRTFIENGQYNSGIAAQIRQGMDKALSALGGKDAALRASNTELVKQLSGSGVFPLIQSLGIGARGLDTPAEREFLLDVMVGRINMEPSALLAITKDRENMLRQSINRFNQRVDSGELDNWFNAAGRTKQRIGSRTVVRTGKQGNRKVIQYSDGSIEYGN